MFNAILLALILLAVALSSYYLSGFSLAHPGVLLSLPLFCGTVCGLLNYRAYQFELDYLTVLYVGLGTVVFAVFCGITHLCFSRQSMFSMAYGKSGKQLNLNPTRIDLPIWVFVVGVVFSAISIIVIVKGIYNLVAPYGIDGSFTEVISAYDALAKRETHLPLRGLAGQALIVSEALAFVWGYLFLRNCFCKFRKSDLLILFNYLLSTIVPFFTGGRGPVIELIVAFVVMWLIFEKKYRPEGASKYRLIMPLLIVAALAVIGALLFRPLLILIGRGTIPASLGSYISLYLGAPLKNFDGFVTGTLSVAPEIDNSVWGRLTFESIAQSLAHWFNVSVANDSLLVMPNQTLGDLFLGNVYTLFYTPLYDWGPLGLFIFMACSGIVAQAIYEFAVSNSCPRFGVIRISLMFYGLSGYALAMSFFMNEFARSLISSRMIRFALVWITLSYVFKTLDTNQSKKVQASQ